MTRTAIAVAVALLATALVPVAHADKTVAAQELDPRCPDLVLSKPSFLSRHWSWSGIFPLYGGFTDDPHITCFPALVAPESVARAAEEQQLSLQLAFLNPFWNDKTSEVLLFATSPSGVTTFRIATPAAQRIHAWVEDRRTKIRVFSIESTLYVLINELSVKGLVELPTPLVGGELQLELLGTGGFTKALKQLAQTPNAAAQARGICHPIEGAFVSLAYVWLEGCPGVDYESEFGPVGTDLPAMYESVWRPDL